MQIHCFYSDLMLSMRYLLDNVVFGPGVIRSYQFNLGNRTLQLSYDTKFELPSAIVNFQASKPVVQHPHIIQRVGMKNMDRIAVLFNKTKRLTLELQEELYEITIDVNINCESQFHAIEMQSQLQNTLPINKYIQVYRFHSFIEVEDKFLTSSLFDVVHDEIVNLLQKYNRLKDNVDYCFSIQYQPLVRLDSTQIQIGSTDQPSYQLANSFTLLNPVPVYLYIPKEERPIPGSYPSFIDKSDVIIPTGVIPVAMISGTSLDGDKVNTSRALFSDDTYHFEECFDFFDQSARLTGDLKDNRIVASTESVINGLDVKSDAVIVTNYKTGIVSIMFTNPLNGLISRAKVTDIDISGPFFGELNGRTIKQNIKCSYKPVSEYDTLNNYTLHVDGKTILSSVKILPSTDAFDAITDINPRILRFVPEKSSVSAVKIIDKFNKKQYHIEIPTLPHLDLHGNFLFASRFTPDGEDEIPFSVTGRIDHSDMRLLYDIRYADMSVFNRFDVAAFVFCIHFEVLPRFGGRTIERLNLNFIRLYEPVASGSATAFFDSMFSSVGQPTRDRKLLRTTILSEPTTIIEIDEQNDKVHITIQLDNGFDFESLSVSKRIYWRFWNNSNIYDSNCSVITMDNRDDEVFHNVLKFTCSREFYVESLRKFSISEPVFFQIYELV